MSRSVFDTRIGNALFKVAQEHQKLQQVFDDITMYYQLTKTERDQLHQLLAQPTILEQQKNTVIDTVFHASTNEFRNNLKLLVELNHTDEIDNVFDVFVELYNADKGFLNVEVESTYTLSHEELAKVTTIFNKKYPDKQLNVINTINHDLIAGLRIKVGQQVYDWTILNQLAQLKHQFEKYQ